MPRLTEENSLPRKFLTGCGTYNWDIPTNLFKADETLAELLDLTTAQAQEGIPIEQYIATVHPEDRVRVSTNVETAVRTGNPCRQSYRLVSKRKGTVQIIAMGQCFRDGDGQPSEFAGMIFAADFYGTHDHGNDITEHCLAAYAAADRNNEEFVAYLLSMVLIELGHQEAAASLTGSRH